MDDYSSFVLARKLQRDMTAESLTGVVQLPLTSLVQPRCQWLI